MSTEIIEFYAEDGAILNGYINKGEISTEQVLIQIHGMTSNCFKNREKTISKNVEKLGIDSICFNTRGSDIIKYIKYKDGKKTLGGTAYEDVEESYYDILGAIKYAVQLGYQKIYLEGHSLGATKIVYTYNKMKKNNDVNLKYVKAIILLSLIDIPYMFKEYSTPEHLEYALKKEKENNVLELMPNNCFLHIISVKSFLRYVKYNKEIDFAKYSEEDYDFKELNSINVPLFIRWGNYKELIQREANNQVNFMNSKIKNDMKDINFIDGADHSFSDKEQILADEICAFLSNNIL